MAEAALKALSDSGESVAAFAARHKVDAHRLYDWRRRTRTEAPYKPGFVEVEAPPSARPVSFFEIVLESGATVRVPSGFDDAALRKLLAVMRVGC